jgi:NADH dehydrogenase [ubiquinone] 1 alpha subcomplex assembly factor 1
MFWEATRRGHFKYTKADQELDRVAFEEKMKWGFIIFVDELQMLKEELITYIRADYPVCESGDVVPVWKFNSQEAIDEWRVACDHDFDEGFSTASFTRSPAGHGLFSGYLDSETLPKDRMVARSGWANISSPYVRRSFFREGKYDWAPFTHLIMRVRGDGRTYAISIRTPGVMDLSWFDVYSFGLYTHGGPYWQYVRIPFSRFFFSSKGSIQDFQYWMPMSEVKSLGITCIDKNTGPYRLEIDYIGLEYEEGYDEKTYYESYYVPRHKYVGE